MEHKIKAGQYLNAVCRAVGGAAAVEHLMTWPGP